MKHLILAAGALTLSMTVSASATDYVCRSGSTERTITIVAPGSDGYVCEVFYAKPSEGVPSKMLWHARSDAEFCQRKADELATKLNDAGWACSAQDAAQGQSTQSDSGAGGLSNPEETPAPSEESPMDDDEMPMDEPQSEDLPQQDLPEEDMQQ